MRARGDYPEDDDRCSNSDCGEPTYLGYWVNGERLCESCATETPEPATVPAGEIPTGWEG
jgi:hypothetical protein